MAPFEVGKFVEVTPEYVQTQDSYFVAQIVLAANQREFFVRYENIFDPQGEKRMQRVSRTKMRPLPPLVVTSCAIGDDVDVPLLNGWWKATVTQVNGPMVSAKLAHHDMTVDFDMGSIRMHMVWNRRTPSIWKFKKSED